MNHVKSEVGNSQKPYQNFLIVSPNLFLLIYSTVDTRIEIEIIDIIYVSYGTLHIVETNSDGTLKRMNHLLL